ncbi:hypothetical protein F0562_025945 [Nyssa sinensis]|uniref:Uncharacterized protein n=1 Tax=Nyssa sinensis TaxID=561372 RepID=A0A5J5B7P0_9ASTE|nr:hypothetical protein F0562_025945 [Nyssa sinensis]
MAMPDDAGGSAFPTTPVVQLATVTRASARLRNVQPEVNLDQSYEVLKRPKKNVDAAHAAAEDGSRPQDLVLSKPSQEPEADDTNLQRLVSSLADGNQLESSEEATGCRSQDAIMSDAEISSKIEPVKQLFVEHTEDYSIPQLERLYTLAVKGVFEIKDTGDVEDLKSSVLSFLLKFAENEANF